MTQNLLKNPMAKDESQAASEVTPDKSDSVRLIVKTKTPYLGVIKEEWAAFEVVSPKLKQLVDRSPVIEIVGLEALDE